VVALNKLCVAGTKAVMILFVVVSILVTFAVIFSK